MRPPIKQLTDDDHRRELYKAVLDLVMPRGTAIDRTPNLFVLKLESGDLLTYEQRSGAEIGRATMEFGHPIDKDKPNVFIVRRSADDAALQINDGPAAFVIVGQIACAPTAPTSVGTLDGMWTGTAIAGRRAPN
jgi:hypothetical protein